MSKKTALVLSGGGARGAYQAGVLKGLAEILPEKKKSPFQIISGVSAGAINTAKLACDIDSFANAVEKLNYLWSQVETDQVFKTELLSFNTLSLGFFSGKKKNFDSLLDTSPLEELLIKNCDFSKIKSNIKLGHIESLIITANNYNTGSAVSFVQSSESDKIWKESRRVAQEVELNSKHIMASSAIPMLFPPIKIGHEFYGDGCVRNNTPCSPPIRMGAEKLFVIGVRTQTNGSPLSSESLNTFEPPSIIRIINTLLNAVLLDSVEQDVRRIQRINQFIEDASHGGEVENKDLKSIPALCISPSEDIGVLARAHAHHLPRLLRMTLSTFGSLDEASEIISYLLFDAQFCRKLIDMGYHDAMSSKENILNFFHGDK
jgi:NTE family protein